MHINFITTSMFIFADAYTNALTLGELSRYLNGDFFFYEDSLTRRNNHMIKQLDKYGKNHFFFLLHFLPSET